MAKDNVGSNSKLVKRKRLPFNKYDPKVNIEDINIGFREDENIALINFKYSINNLYLTVAYIVVL